MWNLCNDNMKRYGHSTSCLNPTSKEITPSNFTVNFDVGNFQPATNSVEAVDENLNLHAHAAFARPFERLKSVASSPHPTDSCNLERSETKAGCRTQMCMGEGERGAAKATKVERNSRQEWRVTPKRTPKTKTKVLPPPHPFVIPSIRRALESFSKVKVLIELYPRNFLRYVRRSYAPRCQKLHFSSCPPSFAIPYTNLCAREVGCVFRHSHPSFPRTTSTCGTF